MRLERKRQKREMKTAVLFDLVPNEICLEIFALLDNGDLCNIALSCRRFRELCIQLKFWDIVIVCDLTDSMEDFTNIKNVVTSAVLQPRPRCRWGFVSYTDHDDNLMNQVVRSCPLTPDEKKIKRFMNALEPSGGEDEAEAMLDGLDAAVKMEWRDDAEKLIMVFADAPPHGSLFHSLANPNFYSDDYPGMHCSLMLYRLFCSYLVLFLIDGCPCGLQESSIFSAMREKNIRMILIGCCTDVILDKTVAVFLCHLPSMSFRKVGENGPQLDLAVQMTMTQFWSCERLK